MNVGLAAALNKLRKTYLDEGENGLSFTHTLKMLLFM